MADARTCPECGAELTLDAREELCPKCIGKVVSGHSSGDFQASDAVGDAVAPDLPAPPKMTIGCFGDSERSQADEATRSGPMTWWDRTVEWARRNPVTLSLAAGIVLMAAVGLAGWVVALERSAAVARARLARAKAEEAAAQKVAETAEILLANSELLLQQALADTNNLRGPFWLERLEAALSLQPTNIALWEAKAIVLVRTNRLAEAIDALSSAISQASADGSGSARTLVKLLLRRSGLLHETGRHQEANLDYAQAGQVQCQRRNVQLRDPKLSPNMLDLSPFIGPLSAWLSDLGENGGEAASAFAEEVRRNTGVEFDLRGGLQVFGSRELERHKRIGPPDSVSGIAVNRRFVRLHILHSTWDRENEGARVGAYVLHYADGKTSEIPILYGRDVRDFWMRDGGRFTRAVVAWQGRQVPTDREHRGEQLFKATWENPRPEAMVRSIDLAATTGNCSPILFGITVEEAAPGTVEFALTKATELEEQGDVAGALATLDQHIERHPSHPALRDAKGALLERDHRTNEALQAFSQAIELSTADPEVFADHRKSALWHRSNLHRKLNQPDQATADRLAALGIPPRDPKTGPELLDLGLFYTTGLREALDRWGVAGTSEEAKRISGTVEAHTGVRFDLRGVVEWAGTGGNAPTSEHLAEAVKGIPVNRRLTRLHFLHGVKTNAPNGSTIGAYVMHYADGQTREFPIVYGLDVQGPDLSQVAGPPWPNRADNLDVQGLSRPPDAARAAVAWAGQVTTGGYDPLRRLCKVTWENPRPKTEVTRVDLIPLARNCLPFLVAATVVETATQPPPGTSPPIELINITNTIWLYNQNGLNQGMAWKYPGFVPDPAQGWQQGRGLFAGGKQSTSYPFQTAWTRPAPDTHYALARFRWSGSTNGLILYGRICVDDGVVVYINGQEAYRFNMPPGDVTFGDDGRGTYARSIIEPVIMPFWVPGTNLFVGENIIAAEVHQSHDGSSDVIFGLDLWGCNRSERRD